MLVDYTGQYSGIVLNQNAKATASLDWVGAYGSQTIYQTFFLPSNYAMGTSSAELRYPDLTGFQVMVQVDNGYSATAALDCTLAMYEIGEGWVSLASGTAIGSHTDRTIWFDLVFGNSVPVTASMLTLPMRVGLTPRGASGQVVGESVQVLGPNQYRVGSVRVTANLIEGVPYPITVAGVRGFLMLQDATVTFSAQQGVSGLWYTSPNPLGTRGQAFRSDGVTPLLGAGTTASINFRVLGLTADSGTDFLGNEYRSCVVRDAGANTSTTNANWMSPPLPSEFAVVSRYFDVRPTPVIPPLGTINLLPNPNFDWDPLDASAFAWQAVDGIGVTRNNLQVQNNWSVTGTQSLRSTSTFTTTSTPPSGVLTPGTGLNGLAIQPGTYSASCVVNVFATPTTATTMSIMLFWYNASGTLLSTSGSTPALATIGVQTLSLNGATAPANTAYAAMAVVGTDNQVGELDFSVDDALLTTGSVVPAYGDGDFAGWKWLAQRGRSASAQVLPITPTDTTIVIDGLLLDPITPNMAFNVYYSTDDSGTSDNMSEQDWEQKLWVRVPQVFTATQRQQYVFPEPIKTKYVKVEFTNLQAQTYDPGNFQQPVVYKKFPTWVADFFILRLESPSFVASQVNVQNDALSFAYAYYLDDLHQTPSQPAGAPAEQIPNLTSFFSQSDAQGLVDASTLANINLILQSFQIPTGSLLTPQSIVGQYAINAFTNAARQATPLSETPLAPSIDYSAVSSLTREPVIFEQSLPVMYFFLTCRHTYKELSSTFEYNRAYFAGVRDIQFLRHNYETVTDSDLYVESGGDTFNAAVNDFIVDVDHNWYTY